jgi:RNA polymerase sigma-70 factor, ECF subfamily
MVTTNQALIKRVSLGDNRAFEELHSRFQGLVRAGATRVLGTGADVDDVCQEVFFTIWREASRYDANRGSLTTWIGILTRRRAVDCLRSRLRHKTTELDEAINGGFNRHDGLAACERKEDTRRATQAMARLPEAHRAALSLVYFGGMTGREAAEVQEVPRAALKTRLWRGIQRMRLWMGNDADAA